MGTKLLPILLLFIVSPAFCQGTESQRKYVPLQPEPLEAFITSSGQLGEWKTHFHDSYTYFDIYLDTPDFLLYQQGYSLRFRKRMKSNEPDTYVLQLKSEMDHPGDLRLEIDEPELDFYRVKPDSSWIPVPVILNMIFAQIGQQGFRPDTSTHKAIQILSSWIQFKAGAALAPFQKLRFLHPETWSEEVIGTLKPVLCGKSIRKRSHIYLDINAPSPLNIPVPYHAINLSEKPAFFIENPHYNWILESSLDAAVFYTLLSGTEFRIDEYEVEQKYPVDSLQPILMHAFETKLIAKFELKAESGSKYKQSVRALIQP